MKLKRVFLQELVKSRFRLAILNFYQILKLNYFHFFSNWKRLGNLEIDRKKMYKTTLDVLID